VHQDHSSGYSIQETLGFELPMHTFEVATSSASNKRVLHVPSKQEVPVTREICLKPRVFENDSLKEVESNRTLSNSLLKPGRP
jgi:hypothetical protein